MVDIREAYKTAKAEIESEHLHIAKEIYDDGEYFIFGYKEDIDIDPVGVNKKTGELITYYPPDHPADAKRVRIKEGFISRVEKLILSARLFHLD